MEAVAASFIYEFGYSLLCIHVGCAPNKFLRQSYIESVNVQMRLFGVG